MAALEVNLTLTLSGADEVLSLTRAFGNRCRRVGSVEEVERRIGRPLDEGLLDELFAIVQVGNGLWIEATPELHRVMAALDG